MTLNSKRYSPSSLYGHLFVSVKQSTPCTCPDSSGAGYKQHHPLVIRIGQAAIEIHNEFNREVPICGVQSTGWLRPCRYRSNLTRFPHACSSFATIVFARYIMLATAAREEHDPKTIGALFFECCDELEDIQFTDALRLLIDLLKSIINDIDAENSMEIDKVIEQFISYLLNAIKGELVA